MTLEGYLFNLVVDSNTFDAILFKDSPDVLSRVRPATYLLRRVVYQRGGEAPRASARISLAIRPSGELIDMYHAIIPHDKAFDLLGMRSDDLAPDLQLNYKLPWDDFPGRLFKFLLVTNMPTGETPGRGTPRANR